MFNRDKLPAMPNPFGSRPDGSPRPPPRNDGYGRPNQQPPPRQGGYDARMSGGYDDPPNYSGQPPQRTPIGRPPAAMAGGNNAREMQLRPIKSPGGNAYAFGNL